MTLRALERGLRTIGAERLRAAIRRLAEHGYVRAERTVSGPPGGRPKDVIGINAADIDG